MAAPAPASPVARPRRALALRLSERKLLLFGADLAAALVALLVLLAWRFDLPFGWATVRAHPGWFVLLAGLWAAGAPLLGAYDLQRASRVPTGVGVGLVGALVVTGAYLAIPYITPPLHTSRLTAAAFVALTATLVAAGRAAYALLLVQPTFRHRVVIVGVEWAGRVIAETIRAQATAELDVVGFIDDDAAKGDNAAGLPVLGTPTDLARVIHDHRVSEIVLAVTPPERMSPGLVQACLACHEQGVQVTSMPALYERLTGKVAIEHAGQALHVILPMDHDRTRGYLVAKRLFDLAVGLVGTLLTLALLPLVAAAIALDGPGPVFYRQRRVGRGGRPFTLVKFRTMVPHAEQEGPRWAEADDARVTRVGRIFRRVHLDELPQAINLLRGEMSFIGPRPERPEFVAALERQIPFYRARHALRPGITGWAQVRHGYASSPEDALVKLQYDLYYNKHCSLALDLVILARTLGLVAMFRGR